MLAELGHALGANDTDLRSSVCLSVARIDSEAQIKNSGSPSCSPYGGGAKVLRTVAKHHVEMFGTWQLRVPRMSQDDQCYPRQKGIPNGIQNKKAPRKALVCLLTGGEGVCHVDV